LREYLASTVQVPGLGKEKAAIQNPLVKGREVHALSVSVR